MNAFLIALIILFALATAYVLVRGIITMAQGKDITGRQSNRYMVMRVGFQAVAIMLVILLLMIGGRGLATG